MSKPKLAEADMLQTDWYRSHDLTLVAQLHACTPQDVIEALGLSEEEIPARYRQHTQPNGKHWGCAPLGGSPSRGSAAPVHSDGRRYERPPKRPPSWGFPKAVPMPFTNE